jgi:hypothetical protein
MKFWEWDAKTWGFALLGAVAAAAFAAGAAAALPAIASACAAACPGVAAALTGTGAAVGTFAGGLTASAFFTKMAITVAVFGAMGAAEGAVMAMITQGGIAVTSGRPMRWDLVGKGAYMGMVYGAGGAVVGSMGQLAASGVSKGVSKAFAKVTSSQTGIGNTKFFRKIGPGMRALAGKHAGKGYGAADDIAGSWKRYSMYGVTNESKLFKIGALLRGDAASTFSVVAGHAGVLKASSIVMTGALSLCAIADPGCGVALKVLTMAGLTQDVGSFQGGHDSGGGGHGLTTIFRAAGMKGWAYAGLEAAFDGPSNSGGGDFGLIGCDAADPTCGQ